MSKYAPLTEFLKSREISIVSMGFDDIEAILGLTLPPSAHTHRAWWSNNPSNNVMTKAWLAAGFQTEQVDLERKSVVFRRSELTGLSRSMRPEEPARSADGKHHPLFGRLKGTIRIELDIDLTEPAEPHWQDTAP